VGRYLSLPILVIAAILQSTLVPEIRVGGGGPDLILMSVLSWMLLAGTEEGIVWAMVGGIVQDLISGIPTGTSALALVVVAFGANLVFGTIARNNLILPPIVAAMGTVVYHLMLVVLLSILGRNVAIAYVLVYVTLPSIVFNFVLMLPIFRLLGVAFNASRPRRVTL
jgi:rod shape-determining protein MreD